LIFSLKMMIRMVSKEAEQRLNGKGDTAFRKRLSLRRRV